jgi:GIY-YIG catalytic domain.
MEESKAYVYVLYTDTVVEYIGVSIEPEQRFKNHFYEAYNKNQEKVYDLAKSRWIRKYHDKVKMKIIFSGTEEECYNKEVELVLLAKTKGREIHNLTEGGDRPPRINTLPNFEEIREKIRVKAVGRVISPETRRKMSESHKASAHLRKKHDFSGANNPRAKKVIQMTKEGEFVKEWDYAQQAIRALGLNYTAITNCMNGKQKTAGGFTWKSKEDN